MKTDSVNGCSFDGECETTTRKVKSDLICYYCKRPLDVSHIITEKEQRITAEMKCHHCKSVWFEEIV